MTAKDETTDAQAVKYRVIAPYAPLHGDEIHLTPGDSVIILHSYDDGWVLGRNITTQSVGLLPRNFITEDVSGDAKHQNPSTDVVANERRSSRIVRSRDSTVKSKTTPQQPVQPAKTPLDANRLALVKEKWNTVLTRRSNRSKSAINLGSMRLSVVGDSGIGKTCLIKALLSLNEITSAETLPQTDGSPSICEVRASTVPSADLYTGEDPLNLTFVDTPGFGSTVDTLQVIRPVVDYHQQQFSRTDRVFSKDVPPAQIAKFLRAGVGAHTHVDICLYGILHRLTPVDLEFMRRLAPLVNIVPVLLKCDTLKQDEIYKLKASVLEEMSRSKIPIYTFGLAMDELMDLARGGVAGSPPFAFYSPSVVDDECGGPREGSAVSEFPEMKSVLLYQHIDDFRSLTADKFVAWRQAGNTNKGR